MMHKVKSVSRKTVQIIRTFDLAARDYAWLGSQTHTTTELPEETSK